MPANNAVLLLSEGFCPVGHGPLATRKESGRCDECGLNFSYGAAVSLSDVEYFIRKRFIDVTIETKFGRFGHLFGVDEFSRIISLDVLLRRVRTDLELLVDPPNEVLP